MKVLLKLRYAKGLYGPYAENLRHVLGAVEGHFISGYADGGAGPDKLLELVPGAAESAAEVLRRSRRTRERFDRGWNDGGGNPPNPSGIKTSYLWREVLTRERLTHILENYAQVVESRDERTGRRSRTQVWPRYHQLDVVRRLLADAAAHGAGRRYLVQHSAGSGKSNSIAWLAHQLIGLAKDGAPVFDSVIVVTDRLLLDRQIRDTIKQYAQVGATVGHADRSGDLRRFIESGKKIIISTVQKFPFILDEIGNEQRGRRFAIIIDEAHSSQGGRTSAAMAQALSEAGAEGEDETFEDRINRLMESRRLLPNASYFAFTATPKNKTLEIFGEPAAPQPDGAVTRACYHATPGMQECLHLSAAEGYGFKIEPCPPRDPRKKGPRLRQCREAVRRTCLPRHRSLRSSRPVEVDSLRCKTSLRAMRQRALRAGLVLRSLSERTRNPWRTLTWQT